MILSTAASSRDERRIPGMNSSLSKTMSSNSTLAVHESTSSLPMTRRTSILTGLAAASTLAGFTATASAADEKADNPELEDVRALLKAHDEAMKNQDMAGIMAVMSEKAAVMGTGPGEIWSGPDSS